MSKIGLRRAGLYYFTAQITSYAIKVLFTIYVARELSRIDYGLFGYILSLWVTIEVLRGGFSFWAGRMMARGGKYLKTLLASNSAASILAAASLSIIVLYQSPIFGDKYIGVTVLTALYVISSYIYGSLLTTTMMTKPNLTWIDPITKSISLAAIGAPLIHYMGLIGALITYTLSNLTTAIALFKVNIDNLEEIIDFTIVREWIKGMWYPIALALLNTLLSNIQLIILGGLGATGDLPPYNMAYRASRFVQFSSALSIALVPALLKGRDTRRSIYTVLDLTLLTAIPITLGMTLYPREVVYLFGWNKYLDAQTPLIILSIAAFINLFSIISWKGILGTADVDIDFTIDLNKLMRSDMMRILKAMATSLIIAVVTIPILYTYYGVAGLALSNLLSSITLFTLLGVKTILIVDKKALSNKIIKYITAAIISLATIYYIPKYRSLYIGLAAIIAAGIYLIIVYLLDPETRDLVKRILVEMGLLKNRGV